VVSEVILGKITEPGTPEVVETFDEGPDAQRKQDLKDHLGVSHDDWNWLAPK